VRSEIETGYLKTAEGSALIKVGHTEILCAASVEETVPPFMRGSGKGWITAEYAMLPRATVKRTPREVTKGRPSGRTHEIQRLIGRSLRAIIDQEELGERTVLIDCDRPSGGRRHTHGVHYRSIRRAGAGIGATGAIQTAKKIALEGFRRRDQRRPLLEANFCWI